MPRNSEFYQEYESSTNVIQVDRQNSAPGSNTQGLGGCVDRLCGGVFNSVQTGATGTEAVNVPLMSE